MYDYPKYDAPFREGDKFYYFNYTGLQHQQVLYMQIRDTSVIFRLLCFGGLKKTLNLNTKERKRFEVYACAMAERNHTLEIWRLLDPEAHLIDHKKLYISSYCIL
ncbi:hypothetical protein DCAR_0310626 [Daucus carota subsp. sativus]|uniref:Peptidase S9A N-terminal domain-containing protein n=1 Tax=Daucus carota subsp. sativus TaxID=79200 RepID=A0A162AG83_DAUCS|nr:hypothetical protein DCAR_0310626 [Daucus carota subsp. sativus]